MQVNRIQASVMALVAAAVVGAALPSAASAQSALASSDAEAFVGDWDLMLMTDQGDLGMDLMISDMDGMVGASVEMPDLGGGPQEITDISRSGEDLVLSYEIDAQGQLVPIEMTLTPSADGLDAVVDFAGGMFVANGSATRAD